MATIKIGGMTFSVGRNLKINGKTLISDGDIVGGAVVEEGVKIELHGNIDSLTCNDAVVIVGNVAGNVNAKGPVSCDDVGGSITTTGPISCNNVGGDVKANIVNCDDVKGSVSASLVNRS